MGFALERCAVTRMSPGTSRRSPMSEPSQAPRKLSAFLRLLPHLKPHRALIAGWLGALAVSSTATLTLPQAVRVMIDRGFAQADAATINASFLGLFAVAAVL